MTIARRTVLGSGLALAAAGAARAADEGLPWRLPELKRVEVDGQSIAYFEQGKGRPLVLVHGMSGSASFEWGRVMPKLAERFRVVAPYQLGFAPSAQPDVAYDAATFVKSLGGFMRALKIDGATIAGESFGGWVVGHYAVAQAQPNAGLPKISRLAILDGAVDMRPQDPRNTNAESLNDPAVKAAVGAFFGSQPRADNSLVRGRAGTAIGREMVTSAMLAPLKIPTLVMWGADDKLLPIAIGKRLAAEVPGAKLAVIADCGHIPSVERPGAFLEHMLAFA